MSNRKTKYALMTFPEQSEAQQLICNINMMREKVYGETYSFEYYENFTLRELRNMQQEYLNMYNSSLTSE